MMDDRPRAVLRDLIAQYGISLAMDPVRTEGLLRDTCGASRREIFVLVNAARQKVPADLLAPRHSLSLPALKEFCERRLSDELGFSEEAAAWAVGSWAGALGINGDGQEPAAQPRVEPARNGPAPDGPVPEDPAAAGRREAWAGDLESAGLATRLRAVALIARDADEGNIRLLIGALNNGNWQVRNAAFDALAALGRTAVPSLCDALDDPGDEIVWRAILLLGAARAPEAAGRIARLLSREGVVRECACWALGEIADRRSATALLAFIGSADPVVQREAEDALRKIAEAGKQEAL